MTFRLGVIGNSHVAAFATAWPLIESRYPGVAVTYFAARGARLSELVVQEKRLNASTPGLRHALKWTSGGSTAIVPAKFDELWLIGMGFGIEPAITQYASCRADSHRPDDARSPVSDAFFDTMMVAKLRQSVALDLYRKLRSIAATPIRIVAQPNPSIEAIDSPLDRLASFRLAAEHCDEAVLWTQFQNAVRLVIDETDAAIGQQPDHTREREIFTAAAWGQGSVRLTRGLENAHPAKDALHMNADYGTLMFDRYLPDVVSKRG